MPNYNSVEEILSSTNITLVPNSGTDDGTFDIPADLSWFHFNGAPISSFKGSGNSVFTINNSNFMLINNRNCRCTACYVEEGTLYDKLSFVRIKWDGHQNYRYSYPMIYNLVLFSSGHIFIAIEQPSNLSYSYTGTNQFALSSPISFNLSGNQYISFYPESRKSWLSYSLAYEFINVPVPFDDFYLVRSGNIIYSFKDGSLSEIPNASISEELFREYGTSAKPSASLISGLADPEILYWDDSILHGEQLLGIQASTYQIPHPQILISNTFNCSDATILGISRLSAVGSSDIGFLLFFNNQWHTFDGTSLVPSSLEGSDWITLESLNAAFIEARDILQPLFVASNYKVAVRIPSDDSTFNHFLLSYVNEEVSNEQ